MKHPLDNVQWIDRSLLKPNDYNPNRVAKREMRLLKMSIMSDGWTQPIVANKNMEIVDGFHRWTISDDPDIRKISNNLIPVVILNETTLENQKMSTIRHNRARGTHGVIEMSKIVQQLHDAGEPLEAMMNKLEMERDEVVRLLTRAGIPLSEEFINGEFSKSWTPK